MHPRRRIGFTCESFSPHRGKFSSTFLPLSAYSHLPAVHYLSRIFSPLKSLAGGEGRQQQAALCERRSVQTAGNRSARRSDGRLLCEPGLALCAAPLFISLTSLTGYMLLIKHAARLLIANQIQFVPRARGEWASPSRTKGVRTAVSELNKRPRGITSISQSPKCDGSQAAIERGVIPAAFQAGVQEVKTLCTLPRHLPPPPPMTFVQKKRHSVRIQLPHLCKLS